MLIFNFRNHIRNTPLYYTKRKFVSAENDLIIQYLKQAFKPFDKPNYFDTLITRNPNIAKTKPCAVLVPISVKQEKNSKGNRIQKSYFTLTKRTDFINSFKGQVCFVGGRRDANDKNDIETALREANEEIGIEKTQITILAQLCPLLTSNGNLITPVVAFFDTTDYVPKLNKQEVESLFELPTERFIIKERYKTEVIKHKKDEFLVHYFEDMVNDRLVTTWGATALLSIIISSILHSRIPEFAVDNQIPLTNENIYEFLDNYLLKKSSKLLEYIANKQK